MNPVLKYFITADNVHIDKSTGKLSVDGFFDVIHMPVFPGKAQKFFMLLGFIEVEKDIDILIKAYDPSGEEHGFTEASIHSKSINEISNLIIEIDDFTILTKGIYTFKIINKSDMSLINSYFFMADYPPQRIFTAEEIKTILENKDLIKGAEVRIQCPKCDKTYNFYLHLNKKAPLPNNCLPFPEDDKISCCEGSILEITGIRREVEGSFGKEKPQK